MSERRPPRFVLGSTSKWRHQVLSDAGFIFESASPEIDELSIFETLHQEGWPTTFIANSIAEAKGEALLPLFAGQDLLLIVGDQLAEFQGMPRGKPKDAKEAHEFLRGYGNAEVSLVSALAVVHARSGIMISGTDTAVLAFADIPDLAIERAIATDPRRPCHRPLREDRLRHARLRQRNAARDASRIDRSSPPPPQRMRRSF
jgi:septum formation protein